MEHVNVAFCMYDSPRYVGGPNVWLTRLLPLLRARGLNVRVLVEATSPVGLVGVEVLRELGFECVVTQAPLFSSTGVKRLLRHFHQQPVDVCVANVLPHAYMAIPQLREAGIATVGVIHSEDEFHRGLLRQFVIGAPRFRLDAVVAVSEFLEGEINALHSAVMVRRIPCGVPLPSVREPNNGDALKLVYMGRLTEEAKRIRDVTRAMCAAAKTIPGVRGVIYGDGPERDTIARIISESGAAGLVTLAGPVRADKVTECLVQHDAFVLLSDYEGLPIALMEAMACGVVPICLDIRGGVRELIEDGVNGLLVNDRGDSFLRAVRSLRENPARMEAMAIAGRKKIQAGYSAEVCAQRWVRLIEELAHMRLEKSPVRVPWNIRLPPQDPGLARFDRRLSEVPAALLRRIQRKISQK